MLLLAFTFSLFSFAAEAGASDIGAPAVKIHKKHPRHHRWRWHRHHRHHHHHRRFVIIKR
jgi:hypothetical protein